MIHLLPTRTVDGRFSLQDVPDELDEPRRLVVVDLPQKLLRGVGIMLPEQPGQLIDLSIRHVRPGLDLPHHGILVG